MEKTQDLVTFNQVPPDIREPFIVTGYRKLHKPWKYYLYSCCKLHNESLNVWTHAGGFVLVLLSMLALLKHFDLSKDKVAWAILVFGGCCLSTLCLSAVAHLLHSKSVHFHHLFFLLDYAGVTIHVFGSGVGSLYICSSQDFHDRWSASYLPILVLAAWFDFFTCSLARFLLAGHPTKRKLLMICGVFIQATLTGIPTYTRYAECYNDPSCTLSSLNHITLVLILPCISGIVFAAHAPERWYPGSFDLIGHSHMLFHICVVCLMLAQFSAIYVDIIVLHVSHHVDPNPAKICFAFLCLFLIEGLTLYLLRRCRIHEFLSSKKEKSI